MAVKVNDGHGTIGAVDGPEYGQSDGVIPAEGDDAWEGLALLRSPLFVAICGSFSGQNAVVAFLYLVESNRVVVSCGGFSDFSLSSTQTLGNGVARCYLTTSPECHRSLEPWPNH